MARGSCFSYSYIDDVLSAAPPHLAARAAAAVAAAMDLAIPGGEAVEKRTRPTPTALMLGAVVDMPSQTMFLPLSRYYAYAAHALFVQAALADPVAAVRECVSTKSVQRLAGKLGWLSEFSPSGRPHLGALRAQAHSRSPPAGHLRTALLAELGYWAPRLRAGTVAVSSVVHAEPAFRLHVHGSRDDATPTASNGAASGSDSEDDAHRAPLLQASDAGDPGGAAIFNGRCAHRLFSAEEASSSSAYRELVTVLDGAVAFDGEWRGRRVLIISDNAGIVSNINRGSSRARAVNRLVKQLYLRAETGGYTLAAFWIPRELNGGPDRVAQATTRAEAQLFCAELGVELVPA